MDLELDGKSVLVAGSSRGIGFAIAKSFLDEGANVVVTGRNADVLREATIELQNGNHSKGQVFPICGDMTDVKTIDRILRATITKFGGIDCVIANVGSVEITEMPDSHEEWVEALTSNFIGGAILVTRALRLFSQRSGANAVLISSIAGRENIGAPVSYATAKAATEFFVKSVASSAAALGVRINAVSPGNVIFPDGNWDRKIQSDPKRWQNFVDENVPLGRFGLPDEIADAVLFLASKRASFITGACLVVDGGQTQSV